LVFFPILSCCTESGDQPQEDLTKSNYKTNKKIKTLRILLYVGQPLKPFKYHAIMIWILFTVVVVLKIKFKNKKVFYSKIK